MAEKKKRRKTFVERLREGRAAEDEEGFPREEAEFETIQPFFRRRKKRKKVTK